jgi:hypothetical protein
MSAVYVLHESNVDTLDKTRNSVAGDETERNEKLICLPVSLFHGPSIMSIRCHVFNTQLLVTQVFLRK